MKFKIISYITFALIISSLITISLSFYLQDEIIDYANEIEEEIEIKKDKKDLYFNITVKNDTFEGEVKIKVKLNIKESDKIILNLIGKYIDFEEFKMVFYYLENEKEKLIDSSKYNDGFNYLELKNSNLPENKDFYIKITKKVSEADFDEEDFGYRNYSCLLEYYLEDYKFENIKDDDEKLYNDSQVFYYVQNNEFKKDDKIIFLTVLGSGINTFEIECTINGTTTNIPMEKLFFNGYGLIIDYSIFKGDDKILKFKLTRKENDNFHVMTRKRMTTNELKINSHFDIILEKDKNKEECFTFKGSLSNNYYVLNFLSYKKNINYYFNKKESESKKINKETMIDFFDTKKYDSICFKIDSNSQIGGLSFEIIETENTSEGILIRNRFHVIRGLPTHHYLKSGTAAFYRPETYKNQDFVISVHFHMTKGISNLYLERCDETCSNLESIIVDKKKQFQDINGFIYINKESNNDTNLSAIVYCPLEEKECEFDIEMKEKTEETYLYKDLRIYSFISKEKGLFKINEDVGNSYAVINVNYFPPENSITITLNDKEINNAIKYNMFENKIYYTIKLNQIGDGRISIESHKTTYCGINYEIKEEKELDIYSLESGFLYYNQDEKGVFSFNNKYMNFSENYILNLYTFGNKLIFNQSNEDFDNNLIQKLLKGNQLSSFTIEKSEDPVDKLLFNIEVHEIAKNFKIFIENGHIYRNRLNSENNEAIYSYILNKGEENNNNKIVINFKKYSGISAKIQLNNNSFEISKLSKFLILEEKDIICNYIFNDLCEFVIKITALKELNDEELDFSIQLVKYEETAKSVFLPQNTFISGLLIPNFKNVYHTKIGKEKEGKIYINFLDGEGTASATSNGKDIKFDNHNKYFVIEKCLESECNIDITIDLKGPYNQYNSNYEYNIYFKIKSSNKFSFSVPEAEYIYGHLDNKDIDYYKTKFVRKTSKFAILINCYDCVLKIYNNEDFQSYSISLNEEFIIDNNNFENNKEVEYSLENVNNIVPNQKYNIRIISFLEDTKLIRPINSIRNEFCKINNNEPCYFIIPIEIYNKKEDLRFLVPNADNANISIIEIEKDSLYDDEVINNYINKEKNYNYKYSEYKNTDHSNEKTLLVKVNYYYKELIFFVSSIFELISNDNENIYQEEYNIINLKNNEEIQISPFEKIGFIDYEINLVKGKGKISNYNNDTNNEYTLESGFQENLNLLGNLDNDSYIKIASQKDDSIFYYRISINENYNNLVELNFRKSNYYRYFNIDKIQNIWPLNFYMKLNLEENESNSLKDINLNYKITKYYEDKTKIEDGFGESYNTSIYLVDSNFILKNKLVEKIEPTSEDLNNIHEYKYEFTAGYSLINSSLITKNITKSSKYYLFIIITYNENKNITNNNNEINIVLSAFDFTENYLLPKLEYFFMLINQKTDLSLGQNNDNKDYNPYIEYVYKDLDFKLYTFKGDEKIKYNFENGKYFSYLTNDKYYKLYLLNKNNVNKPNLFIRQGLSNNENFIYFEITNKDIIYKEETQFLEFLPIKNNINDNFEEEEFYTVYNIRLFKWNRGEEFINKNIYESDTDYILMKYIHKSNEKISLDISKIVPYGYFNISILAEARFGNIYEYFTYEPCGIKKIYENKTIDINISTEEQFLDAFPEAARDIIYIAKFDLTKENGYIKLSLKQNNEIEEDNYIFVGTSSDFMNSTNLYEESQYKVIERKHSLIIPVSEVISSNSKELYIRIPCRDICDYTLSYIIYEYNDIKINNNECFDINMNSSTIINEHIFKYKKNNKNSLFTITSYSLQDFTVQKDNKPLDKTYFNGYSYIINNSQDINEDTDIKFTTKEKLRVKVCHRFLYENTDNEIKKVFDGDIIYSSITGAQNDCFQILKPEKDKNEIKQYKMTLISKTKDIKLSLYNDTVQSNQLNYEIDEPFKNIYFDKEYSKFCISKINSKENEDYSGVIFQLLSINNNNYYNQSLNMPLIKGISNHQNLTKGQILYYRINENTPGSENINVHFQIISGNPKIYSLECDNYPNCFFSADKFNASNEKQGINNNIYFNINIKEEDIYHKSKFPVVVVYCPNDIKNGENEDDCNYYIEMSNNKDSKILLNKNRKIYSYQSNNKDNYIIYISPKELDFESPKLYIQLYPFTGDSKPIYDKKENDLEYNNNAYIRKINLPQNKMFLLDFQVEGSQNSYYSLFYYIVDEKNDKGIYLPSGEVHYSILPNNKEYFYYFQDPLNKKNLNYIVSINAINYKLEAFINSDEKETKKNFQFNIKNNEKIGVKCQLDSGNCEFTISAVVVENEITKESQELIFNDRTYHYYKFSNDFKKATINYFIYKDINNEKNFENKDILININKKSEQKLLIKYYTNELGKNKTIIDYNEIIYLNNLTQINEKYNIYYIIITIEPIVNNINDNQNNDIEFKIKINGNKELYSPLDNEEFEYGFVNKNFELLYYYISYNSNEQIYFDCKGEAKSYIGQDSDVLVDKNYYNIENNDNCKNGCKLYIKVKLSSEKNENNYFNIYILSNSNELQIFDNTNIYGNLRNKGYHLFKSQVKNNVIFFNLNCQGCLLCIYENEYKSIKECKETIEKPKMITLDSTPNRNIEIKYLIYGDNPLGYYYFSLLNSNSPKFLYSSESTLCYRNNNNNNKININKFILPLYKYFSYNQKKLILFVPENEKAIIYTKYVEKDKTNYNNILNFDLTNDENTNSSKFSPITNRKNITITDYYNEDGYLLIQVDTSFEFPVTLIVSQIYNQLYDGYPNPRAIHMLSKNNLNDINNIKNGQYNKISISLIEGSGSFSLNENEDNIYSLSYETQETVSIIKKGENIHSNISSDENEFIFYLETDRDNKIKENNLIIQKTNYLKYFKEGENSIFPIKLNFGNNIGNNNNELYIYFHFSELELENENKKLINCTEEKFSFSLKGIYRKQSQDISINNKKYYNHLRRGYIHLNQSDLKDNNNNNYDYLQFIINKDPNLQKEYKKVFLEVTPLYIDKSDIIELPRNIYMEMNLTNNKKIVFSKPNEKYNDIKIEYAYKDESINLNLNKNNDIDYTANKTRKYGKIYYNINDTSMKYSLNGNVNGTLLRYTTKKKSNNFYINESSTEEGDLTDNITKTFTVVHSNIINDNFTNYKVSFIIRLYYFLDFYFDSEINNIYIEKDPIYSFRKELDDSEIKNETLIYPITFEKLELNEYYLSIIAEITYDDNVEYLAFNYKQFSIKPNKDVIFDPYWVYPLVFVILMLVILSFYLIRIFIKSRAEKNNNVVIDNKKEILLKNTNSFGD